MIVLSDGLLDHTEDIKAEIQKLMSTNATHFKSIIEEGQKQKIFSEEIDSQYLIHFTMGSFRLQMLKWKMSNFTFDIEIQGIKTMNNLIKLLKNKP